MCNRLADFSSNPAPTHLIHYTMKSKMLNYSIHSILLQCCNLNTEVIIKKVNQRMYVLRKLNSFCVQKKILRTFSTTFIESVLSFSFLCWYSSLSLRNKNRLQTLVRTCSKIIGVPLRCLAEFYKQQMLRKTRSITGDDSHPLKFFFEVLPSGRRFRSIKCSSNRYKCTFVPEAIRFCNSKS